MESIRSQPEVFSSGKPSQDGYLSAPKAGYPSYLFRHKELTQNFSSGKKVHQKRLTNALNHLHFLGKPILVHLQHPRFNESLLVKAFPEPCLGGEIICLWLDEYKKGLELEKCRFLNFFVDDSPALIFVQGQLGEINHLGLTVQLPEVGYTVGARRVKRYACRDIAVEITQNGFQASGELLDFSPLGFRVHVTPMPPFSFHGFSAENMAGVRIGNKETLFFSGSCRCLRQRIEGKAGELVLIPAETASLFTL